MENERYLKGLKKLFNYIQLPQPLDIELSPYRGTCYNFHNERSLEMAKVLFTEAKENNLNKMHAVIGAGHENQVAYYLKNIHKYINTDGKKLK